MNRSPLCHLLHWNCRTAVLSVDKAIRMAFHFRSFTPFSRSFEHSHTHTYTHVSLDTSQFYSSYCHKKFELCMLDAMMVKMVMELSNLVQPLNVRRRSMNEAKYFYDRKQQQQQQQLRSHNTHHFPYVPLLAISRSKPKNTTINIKQVTFLPPSPHTHSHTHTHLPRSLSLCFLRFSVGILMVGAFVFYLLLFAVAAVALKRRK